MHAIRTSNHIGDLPHLPNTAAILVNESLTAVNQLLERKGDSEKEAGRKSAFKNGILMVEQDGPSKGIAMSIGAIGSASNVQPQQPSAPIAPPGGNKENRQPPTAPAAPIASNPPSTSSSNHTVDVSA